MMNYDVKVESKSLFFGDTLPTFIYAPYSIVSYHIYALSMLYRLFHFCFAFILRFTQWEYRFVE